MQPVRIKVALERTALRLLAKLALPGDPRLAAVVEAAVGATTMPLAGLAAHHSLAALGAMAGRA
jgi:hypothetical protein